MKHAFVTALVFALSIAVAPAPASAADCVSCALLEARCNSGDRFACLAAAKCWATCTTSKASDDPDSSAQLALRNAVVVAVVPLPAETELALDAGGAQHEVVCVRNLRALCAALEPGNTISAVAQFPPSDADDQRFVLSRLSVSLASAIEPPLPPGDGDGR